MTDPLEARARKLRDRLKEWNTIHDGDGLILAAMRETAAEALERAGPGAFAIVSERLRQRQVEGWTPQHDDEHALAELSRAAVCYALHASKQSCCGPTTPLPEAPPTWPWNHSWWKPSIDPIRNLEKAGALIAAEIDRLKRAAAIREGK